MDILTSIFESKLIRGSLSAKKEELAEECKDLTDAIAKTFARYYAEADKVGRSVDDIYLEFKKASNL